MLFPEMELAEAYKKARPMYEGRMEHTFIVLKEGDVAEVTGANLEPLGAKRPAPDEPESGSSKKKAI